MTRHEILKCLALATESHVKRLAQGGHGHPLTIRCFEQALHDNARMLDDTPGRLIGAFRNALPPLIKVGFVEVCDDRCGLRHLILTSAGEKQLEQWDREGCRVHQSKGRPTRFNRKCAAPELRPAA